MFCRNCGQSLPDNTVFCTNCGTKTANLNRADSKAEAINVLPVSSQLPAAFRPGAVSPSDVPHPDAPLNPVIKKKKKKHVALWISLTILMVILLGAGYLIASLFGVFGPKDLGVKYTEKDYQSALTKIGTQTTFDKMSGDELRQYNIDIKKSGTKMVISDYTWEFSDYQEKNFELTPEEATAFINEIAPGFFWLEDQQVNILKDGSVEASGTLLAAKAISELYPELKDLIPVSVPEKLDLYAAGGISIKENVLTLDAKEFKSGIISPVSAQTLNENAFYFEALYTSVPGLVIHSLEVNDQGNFEVSALIPQTAAITKSESAT